MNKTSVTTLYLYAFLFTLSAWLCDVTFTADRSCTLVGCDSGLRSDPCEAVKLKYPLKCIVVENYIHIYLLILESVHFNFIINI